MVLDDRSDAVIFRMQRGLRHGGESALAHEVGEVLQRLQRTPVRFELKIVPQFDQSGPGIVVVPLQMNLDQALRQIDSGRVQPPEKLPAAAAQRDRRLQLMGAAAGEGILSLLQFGEGVAEFLLTVEQFGHRIDRDLLVLVVKKREEACDFSLRSVHLPPPSGSGISRAARCWRWF